MNRIFHPFRLFVWCGILVFWTGAQVTASPPNIVLIYADDLGYGDIGVQGATAIQTPRIDQLASEGLRFTNAHSPASTCTPSRYSFLTGEYAWRTPGTGIASGIDPLLIRPGSVTVPGVLRQAGYATAVIGKWHLGLGSGTTDYNHPPIAPGPLDIGFDRFFGLPATGDRVPCVYIDDDHIFNFDPADPLLISYTSMVGDEPTGTSNPELLKYYTAGTSHSRTIINGIGRIGWMDGVVAARWVDEDIGDVLVDRATTFLTQHAQDPFFLFFSLHDVHVPRAPHARFQGTSAHGWRGDAIHQLDWMTGAILDHLDQLNLTTNTLVIFTSDNGPVLDDGYNDGAGANPGNHDINGPYRGGKYSLYEGGHRVPFLVRWPGHVPVGVSSALLTQTDLMATFAALTGQPLPTDAGLDSINVLPALLGQSATGRDVLVSQNNGSSPLAVQQGNWKYHDNTRALYDLGADPGETTDLRTTHPTTVNELQNLITASRATPRISSLRAWWPMDDGMGTEVRDRSENRYHGQTQGGPQWVEEEGRFFLHFDGANDTVAADDLPSLAGDLTLACWARAGTTTWLTAGSLISRRSQAQLYTVAGTARVGVRLFDSSGGSQSLEFDPATLPGFTITNWHHYAASYDADADRREVRLYIDGISRATNQVSAGTQGLATSPLYLGSDAGTAGSFFQGDLVDARIYNQVLAPQRVANMASARLLDGDGDAMLDDWELRYGLNPFSAADATDDPDLDQLDNLAEFRANTSPVVPNAGSTGQLIGHWPLDETSGDTTADVSGEDHPGTVINAPTRRSGSGRNYFHFNGINEYVNVEGLPDLTYQVTAACWARSDVQNWNVAGTLMSRRPQWVLHPWLNSLRFSFLVVRPDNTEVNTEVNLGTIPGFELREWHHYAGTYDANTGIINVFVDGILRATRTITPTPLQSTTGPLAIGRDVGRERYLDGSIDDVRLYNRALQASELLTVMEGFDDDQDGLSDHVERVIIEALPGDGLVTLADVLPQDDFDGDGSSNQDEDVAGTSAIEATDRFRVTELSTLPGHTGVTVRVFGHAGRTYTLEDISDSQIPGTDVDQQGPLLQDDDTQLTPPGSLASNRTYRVRVERPAP